MRIPLLVGTTISSLAFAASGKMIVSAIYGAAACIMLFINEISKDLEGEK